MDKLHRLASGGQPNDVDGGDDLEEAEVVGGFARAEIEGGFARATAVVAKEGLREGLAAGKELELQKGFDAGYRIGVEIGLTIGAAQALVANKSVVIGAAQRTSRTLREAGESASRNEDFVTDSVGESVLRSLTISSNNINNINNNNNNSIIPAAGDTRPSSILNGRSQFDDLTAATSAATSAATAPTFAAATSAAKISEDLSSSKNNNFPPSPADLDGLLEEIETDLRTLEKFVSKRVVPDPNAASCCGEGDCNGGGGGGGGGERGGGRGGGCNGEDSILICPDHVPKDQAGRADDCLVFAKKLDEKIALVSTLELSSI